MNTQKVTVELARSGKFRLDGSQEALTVAAEDEAEAPLHPYRMGEEVYLPFLEILHEAGINVIASESVEADEYAFAVNDDIFRIAFTHDQSGAPVSLEAYKNNEPQIVVALPDAPEEAQ